MRPFVDIPQNIEGNSTYIGPHFGTVPVPALGWSLVPVLALGSSHPQIGTCNFLSWRCFGDRPELRYRIRCSNFLNAQSEVGY